MGIGVSLVLIAAGAILTWGVNAEVSGLDLQTVGIILMVVGAVGGLISLIFWSSWGGCGRLSARDRRPRAASASSSGARSQRPTTGRLRMGVPAKGAHSLRPLHYG